MNGKLHENRIRELRKVRGWSQTKLGEKIGVSHVTISRLENGIRPLSLKYIYRLSDTLECHPSDLLPAPIKEEPEELKEFLASPLALSAKLTKEEIAWIKSDPVIAYTNLLALAADAPHPATAKLFINWLLSEEGQNAIRDVGRIPARPGIGTDPPGLTEGLNLVYTTPSMAADYNEYAEKWNSILALE